MCYTLCHVPAPSIATSGHRAEPAFLPAASADIWRYLRGGMPQSLDEMFVSARAVHALGSITVLAVVDQQGACGAAPLIATGILSHPRPVPRSVSFVTPPGLAGPADEKLTTLDFVVDPSNHAGISLYNSIFLDNIYIKYNIYVLSCGCAT